MNVQGYLITIWVLLGAKIQFNVYFKGESLQ